MKGNQRQVYEEEVSLPESNLNQIISSMNNATCIKGKEPFFICIDGKCQESSPFICFSKDCQCVQTHEKCDQKRLSTIISILESKKIQTNQVQLKLTESIDSLIDKLSIFNDHVVARMRQGRYKHSFERHLDNIESQSKQIMSPKQLTGSLIFKVFNSANLEEWSAKNQEVLKRLQLEVASFQQKELKSFTNKIQSLFLSTSQVQPPVVPVEHQFSKTFLGLNMQVVEKLRVKMTGINFKINLGLTEPSINTLLGSKNVLQWRVRILNIHNWIGVGICLRKVVQQNNFLFDNYTQPKHGCYLISSNQYTWCHGNQAQNQDYRGLGMVKNDVITITLNLKTQKISFHNQTYEKLVELNLVEIPDPSVDQFHICVALYHPEDEAEILEGTEAMSTEEYEQRKLPQLKIQNPPQAQNTYYDANYSSDDD